MNQTPPSTSSVIMISMYRKHGPATASHLLPTQTASTLLPLPSLLEVLQRPAYLTPFSFKGAAPIVSSDPLQVELSVLLVVEKDPFSVRVILFVLRKDLDAIPQVGSTTISGKMRTALIPTLLRAVGPFLGNDLRDRSEEELLAVRTPQSSPILTHGRRPSMIRQRNLKTEHCTGVHH